jgi:hypothetical protein
MLRQGSAGTDDWRRFLSCCFLVDGEIGERGIRVEVWGEQPVLPVVEQLAQRDLAEVIRPGTGPALLPVPGGRVPLNDDFLGAIRRTEDFAGLAGEGVGRGAIHLWAVARDGHLNVLLLLHDVGPYWAVMVNPCRIPAGRLGVDRADHF